MKPQRAWDSRPTRSTGRERALLLSANRLRKTLSTSPQVSRRMARVRTRGTEPELVVRSVLTSLGRRYRVANRNLAGSPDIANRSKRWIVFVHGCFWHQHVGCSRSKMPKTNRAFWRAKLRNNLLRDRRITRFLRKAGYSVEIIWACQTRDLAKLRQRLERRIPA